MALIGTGSQAEFQALAFRAVPGIHTLRIWDIDPAAMDTFERNITPLGFTVHRAANAVDACAGADIVTTCTADKTNATVLTDAMVRPGMHLNAIGGDRPGKTELDVAILRRADVFVEFPEQTRVEGEIQQLPRPPRHRAVAGAARRRWRSHVRRADHRLRLRRIRDRGLRALCYLDRSLRPGQALEVDLIADPDDPKDLFALVAAGRFDDQRVG